MFLKPNKMKKISLQFSYLAFFTLCLVSCSKTENQFTVNSPNDSNSVEFSLTTSGHFMYLVKHKNKTVIDTSLMSFDF
jgi:hypothetical protein